MKNLVSREKFERIFSLRKIKVLNNSTTIEYRLGTSNDKYLLESDDAPDPSLLDALENLKDDFCGVFNIKEDDITMKGFEIKPKADNDNLQIFAMLKTKSGKQVSLNTPEMPINSEYFTSVVDERIEKMKSVVIDFIYGIRSQQEIDFDDGGSGKEIIAERELIKETT